MADAIADPEHLRRLPADWVDASAILLTLISLTGLLLLYFVYKHRAAGYLLMGLGSLATYIAYLAWVP